MNHAPLNSAKVFQGFGTEGILLISELGQFERFSKGEIIFSEGEPGSYLYVVLDGTISIHCGDKYLAKCRATEAFGEMAAFGNRRRSATARAVTDVELLLLNESALSELLRSSHAVQFLLNIIHVLCKRLEVGNTWISSGLEAQRRHL